MTLKFQRNGLRKTVFFPQGGSYRGEWLEDLRHGNGTMVYKNGEKYEGEWVRDLRDGIGSFFEWKEGKCKLKYVGEWKNDEPMGEGVFHDDNEYRYEGQWKCGKREGCGRLMHRSQEEPLYEGEWKQDMKDGRGTERNPNGDIFIGHWKQGLKHGSGSHLFVSKNRRLDGVWKVGNLSGGTYMSLADTNGVSDSSTTELPYLELQDPEDVISNIKDI